MSRRSHKNKRYSKELKQEVVGAYLRGEGNLSEESLSDKEDKNKIFVEKIFDFISERKNFVGTATELANLIAQKFDTEIFPNRLTRDLVQNAYELANYGIKFSYKRSKGQRIISLIASDGKNEG